MPDRTGRARDAFSKLAPTDPESLRWVAEVIVALDRGDAACRDLSDSLAQCAARAEARAFGMDFRPLYDAETKTFFIGYNLVMGIGGIIYLFALAPMMTAGLVIGIPVIVIPVVLLGRKVRAISRSSQDRIADLGTIVAETLGAITSERQGRIIDHDGAGSMERKKQEGYF